MSKSKAKHKDSSRRKKRYDELRQAGFTSNQANRFKDMNDYKIQQLIDEKLHCDKRLDAIVGGS